MFSRDEFSPLLLILIYGVAYKSVNSKDMRFSSCVKPVEAWTTHREANFSSFLGYTLGLRNNLNTLVTEIIESLV